MGFTPDLDAYFARIGYAGSRSPTRDVLDAIVRAHVSTIPFENIDVLLGRPIDLAPAALEQKLVRDRRGGYCFEQNGYLLEILRALGFEVRPLSARVRIGRSREWNGSPLRAFPSAGSTPAPVQALRGEHSDRDFTPARTHCFVQVTIDRVPLLADVGVGALSPTASLRFDLEGEQATPHEPRRLVREGSWSGELRDPRARIFHQAKLGTEWVDICELTLEEMPEIDRVVGNWYTSASPQSHFRGRLIVARASEHGRITLADDVLTIRGPDGIGHDRKIDSRDAMKGVLAEQFGIRLDAPPFPPF